MTRFTTVPLASLLFLVLALPAAAAHEDADRKDRSDRRAKAEHLDRKIDRKIDRKLDRRIETHRHDLRCGHALQRATRQLERQTARLLRHAVRDTPHPTRGERRALKRLHVLHREARNLHAAARHDRPMRRALRDYRDVERAFHDARSRFRRLDPDGRSRRQLRQVASTLRQIEGSFAPVIAKTWGHANHGYEVAWRH